MPTNKNVVNVTTFIYSPAASTSVGKISTNSTRPEDLELKDGVAIYVMSRYKWRVLVLIGDESNDDYNVNSIKIFFDDRQSGLCFFVSAKWSLFFCFGTRKANF